LPQTVTVAIPAGTYTAASPVALSSLNKPIVNFIDADYASLSNPATQEESFTATFTGTCVITLSAETFTDGSGSAAIPNAWIQVGTTSY